MTTKIAENYEAPALHELGQAKELTFGLPEGDFADMRAGLRIQHAIVPEGNYEAPAVHELGQAKELTFGLPEGDFADMRAGLRIQHAITVEE